MKPVPMGKQVRFGGSRVRCDRVTPAVSPVLHPKYYSVPTQSLQVQISSDELADIRKCDLCLQIMYHQFICCGLFGAVFKAQLL